MKGEKPREIAAEILLQRQHGHFVETLMEDALESKRLPAEDRRFLQELVYGTVRWELTLDWLITQKAGTQLQKPIVQNLLRLALYQMFWLERVPSYAAVNESVEICKRRKLIPQAKFINAVLRGYSRELDATKQRLAELRSIDLSLGYSHPEWICRRWESSYGRENTVRLLEWNNSPPPTFARVNSLKITAEELEKRWESEGVRFERTQFDWVPDGWIYKLLSHPAVGGLESFREGGFYVQDPSTLLAPRMLEPKPGESVLDFCAAPGGKTTHIAQLMGNDGEIVALDLEAKRLKLVKENCARLGITCVSTELRDGSFDRVLVDAPCSNTGVARRRIELRWRIKPEEVTRLAGTQLGILKETAKRTRAGGVLVYSTCSLEREENQEVAQAFLTDHPDFKLEAERELTPMSDGVDGAYCARLRRKL